MRISTTILLTALALLAWSVPAQATTFTVGGNSLTTVTFLSEAVLERIQGVTQSVSGTVETDLQNPEQTTGTITIDAGTFQTGINDRDEHLRGENWLNAALHPNITFDITSVDAPEGATLSPGNTINAQVTGNLTFHGVTKQITAPAEVTYYLIEGEQISGTAYLDSNVLRIVSDLEIHLPDYGIEIPSPMRTKVAEDISIQIRLTGIEQSAE